MKCPLYLLFFSLLFSWSECQNRTGPLTWPRANSSSSWVGPLADRRESAWVSPNHVQSWERPGVVNSRVESSSPPVAPYFSRRTPVHSTPNPGRHPNSPNSNRIESGRNPPTRSNSERTSSRSGSGPSRRAYSSGTRERPSADRPKSMSSSKQVSSRTQKRPVNSRNRPSTSKDVSSRTQPRSVNSRNRPSGPPVDLSVSTVRPVASKYHSRRSRALPYRPVTEETVSSSSYYQLG